MASFSTAIEKRQTTSWLDLNKRIIACQACPRLRSHCQDVATEKRRAYVEETYWGQPVPNFGGPGVSLLIVGLAPGAHGANRTGRMFTGDRSGMWLYRALHRAGFSNQPSFERRDDGLKLYDCAITAVCHCAPPDNKPKTDEIKNCQMFLDETVARCRPKVFLCLGQIAWNEVFRFCSRSKWLVDRTGKFKHGNVVEIVGPRWLVASYHPSQQNTFTRRLTEPMFDEIFQIIRKTIERSSPAKSFSMLKGQDRT